VHPRASLQTRFTALLPQQAAAAKGSSKVAHTEAEATESSEPEIQYEIVDVRLLDAWSLLRTEQKSSRRTRAHPRPSVPGAGPNDELVELKRNVDRHGNLHIRYQQKYA